MLVIFKFCGVFHVLESLMGTLHQLKLSSEGCGGFDDLLLTSERGSVQGSSASLQLLPRACSSAFATDPGSHAGQWK